ncbi:MAG: PHP domain-containing protein [Clostridia bacterium]|nr:PHP domain-containing protein [Clostridia bacterium]
MPNSYIDLHSHTTASDGTFTPEELINHAAKIGLSAIAITDHDTIAGLPEARDAGRRYGIEIVNGIEFSVGTEIDVHLLGLDFDYDCPSIANALSGFIDYRDRHNRRIIEKLNGIGIDISYDEALEYATSSVVGRSQIARVMVKRGYVGTVADAFEKYLSPGMPGFVPRDSLTPEKAIEIIHASNGIASLAHLNQIKMSEDDKFEFLAHLAECGLDACEGYYTEYTQEQNVRYRDWAARLGLKLSGGSDFHGMNKIGHELGNVRIPYEVLKLLRTDNKTNRNTKESP